MLRRAPQQVSNHLKISLADFTGKDRVTKTGTCWSVCNNDFCFRESWTKTVRVHIIIVALKSMNCFYQTYFLVADARWKLMRWHQTYDQHNIEVARWMKALGIICCCKRKMTSVHFTSKGFQSETLEHMFEVSPVWGSYGHAGRVDSTTSNSPMSL